MPASCSRRRFGFPNTAPKARSESIAPRITATVSEDCSLCCKCEGRMGRFRSAPPSWGDSAKQTRRALPTRRDDMSEDEAKKVAGHEEEQDEVEAHRRHAAA